MKLNHPEIIFVIFALLFGTLIMFITPPSFVCDEPSHFARAKEVSKGILYNKPLEKMSKTESKSNTYNFHGASGYSPVMYIFSGMGLKISHNNYYVGRFFNLIVWIILIAVAIHITPVFKWPFFVAALLPTSIFEGMSYAADSFSNAFAFLFFAYIFKLIYGNREFSYKKDLPILYIFCITGALCKGIIFPLFLFPLIPIKKHKFLIFISLIITSLTITFLLSSNNYTLIRDGVSIELNKHYLLNNPQKYIAKFMHTTVYYFADWIRGAIGILYTICLNKLIIYLSAIMLLLSIILIPVNNKIPTVHRNTASITLIIQVFMTCTLMYFMFTPYDSEIIQGIQGRYFISAIPLIFIIFGQNISILNAKYTDIFKRILTNYIFIILCYTCFIIQNTYKLL